MINMVEITKIIIDVINKELRYQQPQFAKKLGSNISDAIDEYIDNDK